MAATKLIKLNGAMLNTRKAVSRVRPKPPRIPALGTDLVFDRVVTFCRTIALENPMATQAPRPLYHVTPVLPGQEIDLGPEACQ